MSGSNRFVRIDTNRSWVQLINLGYKIAEGILSTRSIPSNKTKSFEMAYRLFYRSRRMPKDIYKWWAKNKKRIELIIEAAQRWKPKEKGTEELFTHGPFTVTNTVGITGAKLEAFKKALDTVISKVKLNAVPGFQKVLYGDIYLVGQLSQAHHAAWYTPHDDVVYCRLSRKKWGFDEIHALIHELGHRYWRKKAPKDKKMEWNSHHLDIKYSRVDIDMPDIGETLPVHVKGAPRGWLPVVDSIQEGMYIYKTPDDRTGRIPSFKLRQFLDKTQGAELRFPTAYSATNEEEHFCEALALLSLGGLEKKHAIPFKAIWK